MNRRTALIAGGASLVLAGCVSSAPAPVDDSGNALPQAYKITPQIAEEIPFRLLDSVNSLRAASGAQPVNFNAALNAASLTHSRDMAVQNRPWHFGSDGSSPLLRVQRVNYTGTFMGELISETFQTELETLAAWMEDADTRAIILNPAVREIGFAWFQEPSAKIWWTMLTGA
jgi:uncharacterized protein YkwD